MDVNLQKATAATQYNQTTQYSGATETGNAGEPANEQAVNEQSVNEQVGEAAVYEKSDSTNANSTVDRAKIMQMVDESNKQKEAFVQMLQKMLYKQANNSSIATTGISFTYESMKNIAAQADQETVDWAKQEISEDGYYGVKQTSERILSFAKAIAGNDPDQIEKMRKAVDKGFEDAERIWGGEMPEITQQTYDAVMKGFDEWSKSVAA